MNFKAVIIAALVSGLVFGVSAEEDGSPGDRSERAAVAISGDADGTFVFQKAASIVITPAQDAQLLVATISDVDGNEVRRFESFPLTRGAFAFKVADLPSGYYTLTVSARRGKATFRAQVKSFAVLEAPLSKSEYRFGIDAALSWYGGSDQDLSRAIYAMRMAGVGAVRDRLSWSKVEPKQGRYTWGRFAEVAKLVDAAGMDQVTVFHDSPAWSRPSDPASVSGDRKPSLDNAAVRAFGQAFARDMGRYVHAIEYWNEQNGDFFSGTPLQYANGLRAFGAGLWSVNPTLKLLVGAASNAPGKFAEQIYLNDVGAWFSVRNQHYYGDPDLFLTFQSKEVAPLDKVAGIDSKPAWLTEAGYGLKPDGNGDRRASERAQAAHLVKTYATAFAAGYERVFYFFLRELVEEGRNNWGILNSDFSPRPAYVALANLTRALNGKPFAGYSSKGSSFSAYFGSADGGYVAVAWGTPIDEVGGAQGGALDMFGRRVVGGAVGSEPFLVKDIKKLPSSLTLPDSRSAITPKLSPIVIESEIAGARVAGAHVTEIPIPATGGVEFKIGLTKLAPAKFGSARVSCGAGPGLSAATPDLDAQFPSGASSSFAICKYTSELKVGARSYVEATVSAGAWSGKTYASVVAIPSNVARRGASLLQSPAPQFCFEWSARSSPVVQSTVEVGAVTVGKKCGSISVTSRVVSPGDGWVFPIADMPPSAANLVGLEFESSPVQGQPYPRKPLMMQLVDSKGGIWVLPLDTVRQQDGSFTHEATFARAMVAPWSKVKSNKPLDTASIKQISIGYAGGGTKPGDVVAFKVTGLRGVEGR